MVQMNENIVGIDAAIFMHPTVWKASGHVDAFNDPLERTRGSSQEDKVSSFGNANAHDQTAAQTSGAASTDGIQK